PHTTLFRSVLTPFGGANPVAGGTWPTTLWTQFMTEAVADLPVEDFPERSQPVQPTRQPTQEPTEEETTEEPTTEEPTTEEPTTEEPTTTEPPTTTPPPTTPPTTEPPEDPTDDPT